MTRTSKETTMQTPPTRQSLITRIFAIIKGWFRKPVPPAPNKDEIKELQRIIARKLYEGEG